MRQVYKIDEQGFYIEPVVIQLDDPTPDGCVETPFEDGLFQPRWIDGAWYESIDEKEKEELLNTPLPLSEVQRLAQQATDQEIESMIQGQSVTELEIQSMIQGQQITEMEIEQMVQGQASTDFELRLMMVEAKFNV